MATKTRSSQNKQTLKKKKNWLINCGQGIILMQDVNNRGNGVGHMGTLHYLLNFSVILTVLKNKVFFKK